ncbi:glycoside hydrolase family 16 protein [Polyporus arcularius HHB13444]|uniref:Glycoside hydrolase family 16 protein n=1 Tax=Polyporus arcularius HHB13444 TaxID=1314778 RepID=A0A5C3NVU1_9APHY|nr:glycoside hydrolase family 16 protein [Polyporus arcularius HHB13444]
MSYRSIVPYPCPATAATSDFAYAQSQWASTWPENPEDRALVVDSVKMWQLC